MSQRTDKVASLVHRSVASGLTQLPDAARLTVTSVEVSPDLRHAVVRIGVIAQDADHEAKLFQSVEEARSELQEGVARSLSTKFVPQISLELDTGAQHADKISRLIKGL